MNLIVDIGNSSVKAALFEDGEIVLRRRISSSSLADAVAQMTDGRHISACAYSVVGTMLHNVTDVLRQIAPRVVRVTGTTPTPLVNDYASPDTLGADRLAAAVGAWTLSPGNDLMVVDAGTCITYDFVSADRHYRGGNISPGLGMRLRALHEQTSLLPLVTADGDTPMPGLNTATAIRSGVMNGMEFEIKGYIQHFLHLHPGAKVFLTGGNAFRFAQDTDAVRNENLVETGLNSILNHLIERELA